MSASAYLATAAAAALLSLSGCVGDSDERSRVEGDTLTIYSSLPLQGSSEQVARAVAAGQRRALADADGRAGRYRVRLEQLDSTRPDSSGWDPSQVSGNAHTAVDDETAIAYIGELDYGGSAVSLPITNDAGLLQVSPLDGLTSLTRPVPGSPRAGPERYYPSERRTFLRLVPNDLELTRELLATITGDGIQQIGLVHDTGIYGRELTTMLSRLGRLRGLQLVETIEDIDEPDAAAEIALDIAEEQAGGVVYAGTAGVAVAPLLATLRRELPDARVYGAAGLAAAGPPPSAPEDVRLIQPVGPPSAYPMRAQALLRDMAGQQRPMRPEAIYGYEAVRLVLDAIERAGPDRLGVARAALKPRERQSLLGRYQIHARGDVTGLPPSIYRLEGRSFVFERRVSSAREPRIGY
jgi:branched-chain amino acid transport system substrate-binding protein